MSEVILVLIGFPGSGKSETGNTVIGRQVFKNEPQQKQETHDVLGLHLTVRDTTGFESLTEFIQIYKSLEDLECQKVVFGLTIRIGRLNPGFIETVQAVFTDKAIGEHLKRRTFLIFTCVDELLKKGEEIYEDKFEKWLRNADDIHKLISSLQLNYCVISNKPGGAKKLKQVEHIVRYVQTVLERGSHQKTWCRISESILNDLGRNGFDTSSPYEEWNELPVGLELIRKMNQEIKVNPYKVFKLLDELRSPLVLRQAKINILHGFLHDAGSPMTKSNVIEVLDTIYPRTSWMCNIS